jgi:hypothetical protein
MMAEGKEDVPTTAVTSRGPLSANFAGQSAVTALLDAQALVSKQSLLRRIFGASPLTADTRSLFQAALADAAVGTALDALEPEWVIVHAVPVSPGSTTLDHLAVGPGGVFVIETRSHSGQAVWASHRTFMVAGIRFPHIRNMEYEMGRVERLLGATSNTAVEVSGILAVVEPKSLTVRQKHRDVAVLASSELAQWLHDQRRVLSDSDVQHIGAAAETLITWTDAGTEIPDFSGTRVRFDDLRRSVYSAWRRQLLFVTLITVLGAGGFILLTWAIMANALQAFGD